MSFFSDLLFGKKAEYRAIAPQLQGVMRTEERRQLGDIQQMDLYRRLYQRQSQRIQEQLAEGKLDLASAMSARGIGDTGIMMAGQTKLERSGQEALGEYGLGLEQALLSQQYQKYLSEMGMIGQAMTADETRRVEQESSEGILAPLMELGGKYLASQFLPPIMADTEKKPKVTGTPTIKNIPTSSFTQRPRAFSSALQFNRPGLQGF